MQKPIEGELISIKEVLELERSRIKSQDRKSEAVMLLINTNNASDERQYEAFRMRESNSHELKTKRLDNSMRFLWIILFIVALFLLVIFGLLFFGTVNQSNIASIIVNNFFRGIASMGLYIAFQQARKHLFDNN